MMNRLGKIVAGRGKGRPTREASILADACNKKLKKQKIHREIEDNLTIMAQGDARKKKKKAKPWNC